MILQDKADVKTVKAWVQNHPLFAKYRAHCVNFLLFFFLSLPTSEIRNDIVLSQFPSCTEKVTFSKQPSVAFQLFGRCGNCSCVAMTKNVWNPLLLSLGESTFWSEYGHSQKDKITSLCISGSAGFLLRTDISIVTFSACGTSCSTKLNSYSNRGQQCFCRGLFSAAG